MTASPIGSRAASAATEPNASTKPAAAPSGAPPDAVETHAERTAATTALRDAARRHTPAADASTVSAQRSALVDALLARVPRADQPAAKTAIPAIIDAARKTGNSDPNRIGYLLATAQTESDFGANMTESGHSPRWFNANYGRDDGNRPGTDDGYRYRGRGYVQTTHEGRYAELSRRLGLPDVPIVEAGKRTMKPALVVHPERLAEPKLAAEALVTGVTQNLFTHNPKAALDATIPVGKPPGQVDFYHARGIVNGIVKDQAQAIARHATTYAKILDEFRHSVFGAAHVK